MALLGTPPVNTPIYNEAGKMSDVWKRWFNSAYGLIGSNLQYAPVDGDYVVTTPVGSLTNETALSNLSTGFLASTMTTGGLRTRVLQGTSGFITISNNDGNTDNPTFTIDPTYVGQTSLTTLGTITTGVWNGTRVSEVYGGTNQSSYTLGDTLYSSSSNTLSKLAGNITTTKKFLTQTGNGAVSTAPGWNTIVAGDITGLGAALTKTDDTNVTITLGGSPTTALVNAASLTLGWTGQLAVSRGGTGISSFGTGIATWLGTPSSANLASAITDETGSGALVFANTPTLVTPLLGTPNSGVLTNCTGYTDANLSLSDITTNNSSTSQHGFLKKLSNSATEYMDGTGNWSTPGGSGSSVVVSRASVMVKTLATGTTTIPLDNTIPQNTEGDQYMTLSYTPANVANILVINVTLADLSNSTGGWMTAALFQDSTANALAAATHYQSVATAGVNLQFRHIMAAGTTSSTTFKVRAGSHAAGTTSFNGDNGTQDFGGVAASSIMITEYTV